MSWARQAGSTAPAPGRISTVSASRATAREGGGSAAATVASGADRTEPASIGGGAAPPSGTRSIARPYRMNNPERQELIMSMSEFYGTPGEAYGEAEFPEY